MGWARALFQSKELIKSTDQLLRSCVHVGVHAVHHASHRRFPEFSCSVVALNDCRTLTWAVRIWPFCVSTLPPVGD